MKLFSHKRFLRPLTLSMASVALAAAVLLTGCGGGSSGGGASPKPNPSTPTQPEEPEETVTAPGEEVKTENVVMKVEKTNVADSVQTDEEDATKAYAPFEFTIKNTSDKPVDLKEQFIKTQNAIALYEAADETPNYKDEFKEGKASEHLTVTLDGKRVPATVKITVYNGAGVEQPGTTVLKEKDWYGTFNVVAQVPASWKETDTPLKVNYELPAQEGVAEIKAAFAVTKDGAAPKTPATLSFKDTASREYHKANSVYIVELTGTITNQSDTTVADLSDFLTGEEADAMEVWQNELAEKYLKDEPKLSTGDIQEKLVLEMIENHEYVAESLVSRSSAVCVAEIEEDNVTSKTLAPGASMNVSLYVMSETSENATFVYNKSCVFVVDENEFKSADSGDTGDTEYDKFPNCTIPTADSFTSVKTTLNGQAGYLIFVSTKVTNTTAGNFNVGNTIESIGGVNATADQIFTRGNHANIVKAEIALADGTSKTSDVVVAIAANSPILPQGQTATATAYAFVPSENQNWTRITYNLVNGQSLTFANKDYTPDDVADLKFVMSTEGALRKYDEGYLILKMFTVTNNSTFAADMSEFESAEEYEKWANTINDRITELTKDGMAPAKAEEQAWKEAFRDHANTALKLKGMSNSCIAVNADESESKTLDPGESTSVMVLVYTTGDVADLEAYYKNKYVFTINKTDFGSSSGVDYENVTAGDDRLKWTLYRVNENMAMATKWSYAVVYEVQNNSDSDLELSDTISLDQLSTLMPEYMTEDRKNACKNEDGTANKEKTLQLAEETLQYAMDHGAASEDIKAVVDGTAYPVIMCANGSDVVSKRSSTAIYLYMALPQKPATYTVQFVSGGKTIATTTYGNSTTTVEQALSELLRPVK